MNRKISIERGRRIIQDLLSARLDLAQLAAKHRLDIADLSRWMAREENRRSLAGLCELADFQTQLMLSQYRVTAANTLILMATGKKKKGNGEVEEQVEEPDRDLVRKACADLLKLTVRKTERHEGDEPAEESSIDELRRMIYGEEGKPAQEPGGAEVDHG